MLTKSTMVELGTPASGFSLPDVVSGQTVSGDDFAEKKALLVMFICRHCPFVRHIGRELARIGLDYQGKDIGIVAISANDSETYLEDKPESLKEQAQELGFTFPYLYDEPQEVARVYNAVCTPDFFLFNKDRRLVYRGQLDDSRPAKVWVKVTGQDLRAAIDAVLNDQPVNPDQKSSMGCSIKWKKSVAV